MFNILLIGIICFFCAFGAVQFCELLFGAEKRTKNRIISVIPLHNNESDVECIVRNAFINHKKIIAVDYGSFDDTVKILHNLKLEFPGLEVLTQEEFISFLKDYKHVERYEF